MDNGLKKSEGDNASEAPKTKKILVATQKTFRFPWYTSVKKIDATCNKWLHEKGTSGTPAHKGETYVKGLTTYVTYMYSTITDIPA